MTMDTATTVLLRETLHEALSGNGRVDVPAMLAELGWDDVLAEDEAGATRLLFEEQGRALAASPALDAVVLRAIGLAAGPTRVLYPVDSWSSPDMLDGLLLGSVEADTSVLTPSGAGTSATLLCVRFPGRSPAEPVDALDPDAHWCRVRVAVSDAQPLLTGEAASRAWARGLAAGRRALASELIGSGRAVLDLAAEQVRDRRQFGRTIGSFQSVRHRLADAYAGLVGAAALVESAWADGSPSTAACAKAFAARSHAEVLANAMQVSGAIGLTWEHALHRHARRGFGLDALLGSADELVTDAGADLLAGFDLPRFPALDVTPVGTREEEA
ncbi:acyl-CoA dehydrogenase family protein [Pseudonocardia sp. KRD291]|uniref:acyl-CoA dehydrogenase family protein n=1 Tax=Pseudonocardia sp. KRD291 TaxID=2792007 RepID=UPI001C4A5BD2|nr:acyl-CoA dehydrogenase family protein [Pseudonocardia sp. KRD291]MBW0101026.1 acyl-CoA dehydrogenase [Pseudonocardia sp. KRD291]